MEPQSIQFVFEKETTGTYRFKELVPEGQPPKVGVLYVKKYAFKSRPASFIITISEVK